MAKEPRVPSVPLDPAFAGEILGSPVHVDHRGLARGSIEGTLVDETMNTFVVRSPDGRVRRIGKSGATGTIVLAGRSLPLNGESLRLRPEDRTKRVAARGRRR
ncbi:MAG: ribonuclease P protein subunit [Thermoplasmata archaeon]|nr:ribonuclease P protein subunit [Thermoplasmata archaeon]MCI4359075.1 ribonuclease P protein subunit [Thermoplasmata archaeon]